MVALLSSIRTCDLVVSWLREFVDVDASAQEIADTLGLRGFEVASLETLPGGDAVIDFEVTANRPDCLSVLGLAREVATAYDRPVTLPSTAPDAAIRSRQMPVGDSEHVKVFLDDAELCPRYAAAVATVTVGPSPAWLASRLQAAGVRPISSIVDITNYVQSRDRPADARVRSRAAGRARDPDPARARRAKPSPRSTASTASSIPTCS